MRRGLHRSGWAHARPRRLRRAGWAHARRGRLTAAAMVATAVILGTSSGSAYAYFTTLGSSSGSGAVYNPLSVTASAASANPDLLPGGTGSAYFTLTNPNPFPVSFNQLTSATVASDNTANCPSANVTIAATLPYPISPSIVVGADTTSGTLSLPGLVKLSASAPSTCQGVTFTVTLTLSGATS
jgi:hypothetical protein